MEVKNGQPKNVVGKIVITMDDRGEVNATTTMPDLATMQAIGIATAKLAVMFAMQRRQAVQGAEPHEMKRILEG